MKRKKLENYLIVVLSVGLILFIAWKFNLFELSVQQIEKAGIEKNIEIWMESAKENLREGFLFMEGENYLFVKGKLSSECTEIDPDSHCPISISDAKIDGNNLFTDNFRFAIPSADIFPYPVNEGVNVLGFASKNHSKNVSLEFEILDYIPNKDLCRRIHGYNKTLCSVKWTKKTFLDEPIPARNLSVEVKDFDYSFWNKTLRISLSGGIESGERPNATLGVYIDFDSRKSLINESHLELEDKNGIYTFEFDGFFGVHSPEQNYSILLLVTGKNSFHAKEWFFDNGELINSVVYD